MAKCCNINPGHFRTPIHIEREVKTDDGLGGESVEWELFLPMRAKMRQLSGGERWFHDRIESRATDAFEMHYVSGIDETMRINKSGVLYNIRSINNVEDQNKYLIITAERGVPQ